MSQRKKVPTLGLIKKRRESLLRNLMLSIILYEKVTTTVTKAKSVRPLLERLTHRAKTTNLTSKRYLMSKLYNNQLLVKKLTKEIAPRYKDRTGGYLRIVKLTPRSGDQSLMARIEYV